MINDTHCPKTRTLCLNYCKFRCSIFEPCETHETDYNQYKIQGQNKKTPSFSKK